MQKIIINSNDLIFWEFIVLNIVLIIGGSYIIHLSIKCFKSGYYGMFVFCLLFGLLCLGTEILMYLLLLHIVVIR